MRMTRKASGLIVPKEQKPNSITHPHGVPDSLRFKDRVFECSYESDVVRFKELVKSKGGNVCGVVEAPFLNIWNDKVGDKYLIVYQYNEELDMEVLC